MFRQSRRFIQTAAGSALVTVTLLAASACHRSIAQDLRDLAPPDAFRDSLIRAVPVDSLARLYRAMLVSPQPKVIGKELTCEMLRLSYLHGDYIMNAANARLLDTLYHDNERQLVRQMDARLAGESLPIRGGECNVPYDKPRAPDSLSFYPPFGRKRP